MIRSVLSRNSITSCAEEKCPFSITCAIIHFNQHPVCLPPFNTKSISLWKIVDTNPLIIKVKQIIDEETNDIYITDRTICPDESYLVRLFSDQSIVFYRNDDYPRCLARLKITEKSIIDL